MNFYLMGTTKLGDRQYEITDSKGFVQDRLGISMEFYGGRVENFAKTDRDGVYLLVEKGQVINILVTDLTQLDAKELKSYAKTCRKEFAGNATKETMLKLFNIE